MEGKLQDQGQIYQYLEEWLYPRWIQPDRGFFSEEQNQDYIWIEDSYPKGEIIINQAPEGAISTMVVLKWSDAIRGPRVKLFRPLCCGLYKELYNLDLLV